MCFKKKLAFRDRIAKLESNKEFTPYIQKNIIEISKAYTNASSRFDKNDTKIFDRFFTNLEKGLEVKTAWAKSCLQFVFEDVKILLGVGSVEKNYEENRLRLEADLLKSEIYRELSKINDYPSFNEQTKDKSPEQVIQDKILPVGEIEKILRIDYIVKEVKDNDLIKNPRTLKNLINLKDTSFGKQMESCKNVTMTFKDWDTKQRKGEYAMNMLDIIKANAMVKINELFVRFAELEDEVKQLNLELEDVTLTASEKTKKTRDRTMKNTELNELKVRIDEFYNNINNTTKMEYFKIGVYNDDYNSVKIQIAELYNLKAMAERGERLQKEVNEIETIIDSNKAIKANARVDD